MRGARLDIFMVITYLANIRFPTEKAHGIQIAKMCEAFVKKGVAIELVVPRARFKGGDPVAFYGLSPGFPVRYIAAPSFFPATRFGYVISAFFFGIASAFYVRHRNPDIVYSIDFDPVSFFFLPFVRQPYFFEMHGPHYGVLWSMLFRRMRGTITINEAIKREILKAFPFMRQENILVFPNGTDAVPPPCAKDEARRRLFLPTQKKIVVYTGSSLDWKGIGIIIDAARLERETLFVLVGVAALDLEKTQGDKVPLNVMCVGRKPFPEMPLWRAAADILLVTGTKRDTYSYHHTSPMKLIEYLGAERPIVASRTPAIEQIVSEAEVYFHEPDNAESLAESIKKAFGDTGGTVARAREKALRYSWDKRASHIISFISSRL